MLLSKRKLLLLTILFFAIGILYYLLFRQSTILTDVIGIKLFNLKSPIELSWFPSFVHQFSFVIFTWLVLEKKHIFFSLGFWSIVNILFETGQSLPKEYTQYFPKVIEDYCNNGTYSHEDMVAIVVATLVAYLVMEKFKKGV